MESDTAEAATPDWRRGNMACELDILLAGWCAVAEETQTWGGGTLPLRVRSYVTDDLPPASCITSVRGLVFQGAQVIVVEDAGGMTHLMPGGRCEAGESWEDTFRREVLEESGWTLAAVRLLGFMHFRHLAPRPDGYRYAYPEFVQVVAMGEAREYRAEARESGGYELEARLRPIGEAASLELSASQRTFLEAALRMRPPLDSV